MVSIVIPEHYLKRSLPSPLRESGIRRLLYMHTTQIKHQFIRTHLLYSKCDDKIKKTNFITLSEHFQNSKDKSQKEAKSIKTWKT